MGPSDKASVTYGVAESNGSYAVLRNDKPLNTPAGGLLLLPTKALAESIANEWRAQKPKPDPTSMPMAQLAYTAIDIINKDRKTVVAQISTYAASELLCHRAEHPEKLVKQQDAVWQPILDWCVKRFDLMLLNGVGIVPIKQSLKALETARKIIEALDDFYLTGLQQAVGVSGSLVLGLALMDGYLNAEQARDTAELDAKFQIDQWGEDPASAARLKSELAALQICENWFQQL